MQFPFSDSGGAANSTSNYEISLMVFDMKIFNVMEAG